MIEMGLEFDLAIHEVVELLLSFPEPLRPQQYSDAEVAPCGRRSIGGHAAFLEKTRARKGGIFLYNERVIYGLTAAGNSLRSQATADVDDEVGAAAVESLFTGPLLAGCHFGYACVREERIARNRVSVQRGINSIEAWVGRDTRKVIPGLYWMTLLSRKLADLHKVDIDKAAAEAVETWTISDTCLVFKMYDAPQRWPDRAGNGRLTGEPWLFDVAQVMPDVDPAHDLMSTLDTLRRWT